MLQKRYQSLLIKHLKKQIITNIKSDKPDKELIVFSVPSAMKAFFDDLKKEYKKGFYVHISDERQDLKQTVKYIGRYARRPPISEVRIQEYTGEWLTFEYKDYRNNASKVKYTLKTVEFIRKLIRHIPPHYFNVIRNYGILASRVKSIYKKITDKLLGRLFFEKSTQSWGERQKEFQGNNPLICKICHCVMKFVSAHHPNSLSSIKAEMDLIYS
jgi:hypothetical protein